MLKPIVVTFVLLAFTPMSHAQSVAITSGFAKAQDFNDWSATEKHSYAVGLLNGITLAPFFGAPDAKMKWFNTCVEQMNSTQIKAIIEKYIKDHPEDWHYTLNIASYRAMLDACPNSPAKPK